MMRILLPCFLSLFMLESFAATKAIIPIEINRNMPYVNFKINNETIPFILDSGASTSLYLTQNAARSIHGLRYTGKMNKSSDLAGRTHRSKQFIVPAMTVNGMEYSNLKGQILAPWGLSLGGKEREDSNVSVIGMDLFKGKKIIIDFSRKALTTTEGDVDILDSLDGWISMPFEKIKEGFILTINDGTKSYRMILDTATTISIIKTSAIGKHTITDKCESYLGHGQVCQTTKLPVLGVHFLQPMVLDLPDRFKADGILGDDFFSKFSVLLDLKNKLLYVRPENF